MTKLFQGTGRVLFVVHAEAVYSYTYYYSRVYTGMSRVRLKNFIILFMCKHKKRKNSKMESKPDNMWQKQPRKKVSSGFAHKFEEPLSKKPISIRLPISAMETLEKMEREERLNFIRETLCMAIEAKSNH